MHHRETRITRAKELLATAYHAAMATVNQDGSPHNTPYFFVYSPDFVHVYWASHPTSQHSKNITRSGQLFVVLYDATQKGGLYIRANNGHVAEGVEVEEALTAFNKTRARFGKTPPLSLDYYQKGEQALYKADVQKMWVNLVEYDADGLNLRDYRDEITVSDLLD